MRYIFAHQRDVCYILYKIADNDLIDCILRMNHVPHPQEEKLGYYFQSGTCLGATHVLLSFLWPIICKWHVINVTLQHLKIATQKDKTNKICSNSINEII